MGYEAKDFKEAFLYDKDQIPTPESKEGMGYKKYYYWGLYGKHLKRYYDIFSSSVTLPRFVGHRVKIFLL
jgi:hypothetical protein